MANKLKLADLNQMFDEAESAHKTLFSEQRSNILLNAGNHYSQRGSDFWKKVRNSNLSSKSQKLRLTQNHIQKITKSYINNILSHAPGVEIQPKNKTEFHDQKVAELHQSVWLDMRRRHSLDRFFHLMAKDFVEIGEAWCKVFFDPDRGQFLGYDTEAEYGASIPSKFTGDVCFERILGFNIMTDPGARSWEECRYVIYQKMVDTADLKKQYSDDEHISKAIKDSSDQTYQLFDGYGNYKSDKKKQTLVKEFYFKPCSEYPNGYFCIAVDEAILHEGELPHGIFPIIHVGFDEASTSARSFSIIKQIRPCQAEINRCISRIVEHHLTLGDDKLLTQPGATVSAGATAHGIKVIKASGQVTHLPGRDGAQFTQHLLFQIQQMYYIANVQEDSQEKAAANLDPYSMLFRSMRDKKSFIIYAEKFEQFIKNVAKTALEYAKADYTEDMVIQVLDKKERVNIPEFKSADDLSFEIALEPATADVESMMGQQIAINHALQYAGANLSPEDTGQMIRAMPFINDEEMLTDLTIDYDNLKSDILAMDRGKFVPALPTDNHKYYIRKLTHRIKMKDFQFLHPAIQSNYQIKLQQHEQFMQQQMQAAAAAQSGFIPSGGFLVTTDIRVPRADDPSKTERAKVPVEALAWLIDRLEKQGQTQGLFQSMPPSSQASVGVAMAQGQQQPGPAA